MTTYSESELAGLTPDEQEALLAEQQPEVDALSAIAAEETPEPALVEPEASNAPALDADLVAADPESKVEVPVKAESDEPPVAEFHPEFVAALPEGIADALSALDTQAADLIGKFQDGNLDFQGYMAQKEAIDAQRIQLKLQEAQAAWAQSQNEASRNQRWEWEQERFFGQKSAEMYKDPLMLAALDASVKQLAGDAAHAKRPAGWFLEEADRQVRSRFNLGSAPAVSQVPGKAPDLPKPQPTIKTIGTLPAAAPNPVGDDIMAKIGALEGEDLEKYFARLSPSDVEKLTRAA